ncbi:hypothetical protein U1Q18_050134, partial [Sarracenia purpurea var. burkii]
SNAIGYQCVQRIGQFHNLWQTEQRKVHLQRLDLDHIKLEARTLAKTSKKNVEYCRKITMERNNIVVELRSRLHLLPSLKYEVNTLQVELENERTELKKEIAEFEGKVAQRIEWHTSSWVLQVNIAKNWEMVSMHYGSLLRRNGLK